MAGPSATPSEATIVGQLWPSGVEPRAAWLRGIVLALLGSALLTLSAKVQVPFWPVPMTLQSLAVLVIGAAYGARLGAATVLVYITEGALGLPVFANTPPAAAGLAYLVGPTGGFLLGFVAAAALVGALAERGWTAGLLRLALAVAAGHVVLFAFGLAWLAVLIGPAKAWSVGAEPFLLATLIKTALAAGLVRAGWSSLGRP